MPHAIPALGDLHWSPPWTEGPGRPRCGAESSLSTARLDDVSCPPCREQVDAYRARMARDDAARLGPAVEADAKLRAESDRRALSHAEIEARIADLGPATALDLLAQLAAGAQWDDGLRQALSYALTSRTLAIPAAEVLPRPIAAADIRPGDVVTDRDGERWEAHRAEHAVRLRCRTPWEGPLGEEERPAFVDETYGPLTLVERPVPAPDAPPSAWMDRDPVEEILPGRVYVAEGGLLLLAVGLESARWLVAMDGRTLLWPEVGPLRLAGAIPASLVEALEVEEAIEALTGSRRAPAAHLADEAEGSAR